jgi:hypothetical protein
MVVSAVLLQAGTKLPTDPSPSMSGRGPLLARFPQREGTRVGATEARSSHVAPPPP